MPKDEASKVYNDGWSTCGGRSYYIEDLSDNTEATWVTVDEVTDTQGETFYLRVAIDEDDMVGDHDFQITVGFVDYTVADDALHATVSTTFTVTIVAAVCECELISWNEPGNIPDLHSALVDYESSITVREAGPNTESLTATAGARACGETPEDTLVNCDYAYTVTTHMKDENGDLIDLVEWMEY